MEKYKKKKKTKNHYHFQNKMKNFQKGDGAWKLLKIYFLVKKNT